MRRCRLFALLLAAITLLLTACGEDREEENTADTETSSSAAELISLIQNGSSDYVLVVPANDMNALSVAYSMRTLLMQRTGVTLAVVKDTAAPSAHEILIGKTNREGSAEAQAVLGGSEDYYVCMSEEKPVIVGGSEAALRLAMEQFVNACVQEQSLVLPADYRLECLKDYLTLLRDGATEYVIVVNKKNTADYDMAYYLQTKIRNATGVRIKIVYDTATEQEKEILFGFTNREATSTAMERLETDLDYYVGASGRKLVICARNSEGLSHAVDWFEETYLKEQSTTLSVALDFDYHYLCKYEKYSELSTLINNVCRGERKTLETVERSTVYAPVDSWFYSHHQAVEVINGVMVAVWSQGRWHEDDCGQRIVVSTSTDFENWTETRPLVDTMMGEHSELVMQLQGVYNNGKQLIVYFSSFEYDETELRENGTLRPEDDGDIKRTANTRWYITTEDGIHWSQPTKLKMPAVSAGSNQGPSKMINGELFWPGNICHGFTHDLSGLSWDGYSVINRDKAMEEGNAFLCECSYYFVGERMYLLCRTNTDYLWVCFSDDYGRTWSDAYKTNFTDAKSKFMFGMLPDGRYYYVGNPVKGSDRNPLVIAISTDGLNFDEQYVIGSEVYVEKHDGMYDGGDYGYPNCYIGNDGYFYVIYSRGKEEVEITRFLLSELS